MDTFKELSNKTVLFSKQNKQKLTLFYFTKKALASCAADILRKLQINSAKDFKISEN
jgi:hypothetical protein